MTYVDIIKRFEGFESRAYQDVRGVWTIGYGHTGTAKGYRDRGSAVTIQEAEELLEEDAAWAAHVVDKQGLNINEYQRDALISFVFNVGSGNFIRSTLLKRIKQDPNDYRIYSEFCRWIRSGGKAYKGLLRRRIFEANHYFTNQL